MKTALATAEPPDQQRRALLARFLRALNRARGMNGKERRDAPSAWVDGYRTGFEDGEEKSRLLLAALIKHAGGEVFLPVALVRDLDGATVIERSDDYVSNTIVYRTRP